MSKLKAWHVSVGLLSLLGLAVVAWLGVGIFSVVAIGLADPPPSIVQQQLSPDGRQKAAVLEVEGGATVPFMWYVAVTDSGAKSFKDRDTVAVFKGRPPGRIAWRGAALTVTYRDSELDHEPTKRAFKNLIYLREPSNKFEPAVPPPPSEDAPLRPASRIDQFRQP